MSHVGGWPWRAAKLLIAVGTLAFGVAVIRSGMSGITDFDRFRVLDIVTDPTGLRHAVVYRHDYADSGLTLTAVWLVAGTPPAKGDTQRPHGRPAAAWTEGSALLTWQGTRLRLIGDQNRVSNAGAESCHFPYPPPEGPSDYKQLCFDPAGVTFVPQPR